MTEADRLLQKVATSLHLAGVRPLKGSMNPMENLLWQIEDYLIRNGKMA